MKRFLRLSDWAVDYSLLTLNILVELFPLFLTVALLICFCLFGCAALDDKACFPNDKTFRCATLVDVQDGDTLLMDLPGVHPILGKNIGIRIVDINTAEKTTSNKCEQQAAILAQDLLKKYLSKYPKIELHGCARDKFFRLLCDVQAGGKSASSLLVESGLAQVYTGGTKPTDINWCEIVKNYKP